MKFLTTAAELAPYHLNPDGGDNLRCTCGCGKLSIAEPAAKVFAQLRADLGRPLTATSGTRCEKRQAQLAAGGGTVAKNVKTATHVLGVALDVAIPAGMTKESMRDAVAAAGRKILGKVPRIGWKSYGNGIVHFDVSFLLVPLADPVNHQPGVMW